MWSTASSEVCRFYDSWLERCVCASLIPENAAYIANKATCREASDITAKITPELVLVSSISYGVNVLIPRCFTVS